MAARNQEDGELKAELDSGSYTPDMKEILRTSNDTNRDLTVKEGPHVLSEAITNGHAHVVRTLLEDYQVAVTGESDEDPSPLYLAVDQDESNRTIVELLLIHGADVDELHYNHRYHRRPLAEAIFHNRSDIVALLLEHNAIVDSAIVEWSWRRPDWYSSLDLVKRETDLAIVHLLLQHGAKFRRPIYNQVVATLMVDQYPHMLDVPNVDAALALHLACAGSVSADVVHRMVEACPNALRCINGRGQLPLHCACGKYSPDSRIIQCLVENFPDSVHTPKRKEGNQNEAEPASSPYARICQSILKPGTEDLDRTILSLKNLEATKWHLTRDNWDCLSVMLWSYYFRADQERGSLHHQRAGPPRIAKTQSLTDQEFLNQYEWMVYAASSLLFEDVEELLSALCKIYNGPDLGQTVCPLMGLTPLLTALEDPPRALTPEEQQRRETGIAGLLRWSGPKACSIRHPVNNLAPLEIAIQKGMSGELIDMMMTASPGVGLEPNNGLYPFERACTLGHSSSTIFSLLKDGALPQRLKDEMTARATLDDECGSKGIAVAGGVS